MQKQEIMCGRGGPGGATLSWATQVSVSPLSVVTPAARMFCLKRGITRIFWKGGNVGIAFF
jgi:flavin reductase (DIM6/NTAB) family NADH-FMN oxidoreductase RutF